MSDILLVEQGTPSTPGAGQQLVYFKTDGKPYYKDDAGVETPFNVGAVSPNFKNRIYNGAWRFDQVNEGALYTVGANTQLADGWTGALVGAGVFKVRRVADPDFASLFAAEITCTTLDASIASTDIYSIFHAVEGYDVADLRSGLASAQQITISFPMKFSVTGVYGVSVHNSALNRSYIGTVTQNVANTREDKTVTLTLDTTGTWLYTSGVGLYARFTLAAGSNFQSTAGSWQAGNLVTTSSQVNFMSSTSNIGYIGRIQLERGAVATEFEELNYQHDLARCQRYYEKSFDQGQAVAQATGVFLGSAAYIVQIGGAAGRDCVAVRFATTKRVPPVIVGFNPASANNTWRNTSVAGDSAALTTIGDIGQGGFSAENEQVAGDAAGNTLYVQWSANARLS